MSIDSRRQVSRYIGRGMLLSVSLVAAFTAASLYAPIEGAVIGVGSVVVETNIKKVQHSAGGIVGQLMVREGQRVESGEVLLHLDETMTRSNYKIVSNELAALRVRRTRLLAEGQGDDEMPFPSELSQAELEERSTAIAIDSERNLFEARARTRAGEKEQLAEQVQQLREEIRGLGEQQRALEQQTEITTLEFVDINRLGEQGLVPRTRVTTMQREMLRMQGQVGDLKARIAQTSGRIAEIEVKRIQVDRDLATQVAQELRDTDTKIAELEQRRAAAEDQLRRAVLRAPISGTVHQLRVHTVGGVVSPAEPVMMIVPQTDRLIVEARISPVDIDQVRVGQLARVRFPVFSQRETPEYEAQVVRIAPDLVREQNGMAYYVIAVRLPDDMKTTSGAPLTLVPGMPAEVYFRTGSRSLASYIVKPLIDHIWHVFKET